MVHRKMRQSEKIIDYPVQMFYNQSVCKDISNLQSEKTL